MTIKQRKDTKTQTAHIKGATGRVRIGLGTKNAKEAKKIADKLQLKDLEAALRLGKLGPEVIARIQHGGRTTVAESVERWFEAGKVRGESPTTAFRNHSDVQTWIRAMKLGKLAPAALKPEHVYDYINEPDPKRSASTRTRQLASIRSYCRYLADNGLVTSNPAAQVGVDLRAMPHEQREKKKAAVFTPAEAKKVIAYLAGELATADTAEERDRLRFFLAACQLTYATGMRIGDVIQLEWATLTEPGHIIVWTDKRDRRVKLPVNDTVTPGLAAALAQVPPNDTAFLFPEWREKYLNIPKRPHIYTALLRYARRAGVDKGVHAFRHAAITRWRTQGFSLEQCADYAGHTSTKTTKGYDHS